MKIIFVTDLHGAAHKYRAVVEAAGKWEVDAVVNGGDMLAHARTPSAMREFFSDTLEPHFAALDEAGIHCLAMLGNDDPAMFDAEFSALCSKYKLVIDIAMRKTAVCGIEFVGMNVVNDFPFRLKDRARLDHKGGKPPPQFGKAIFTDTGNFAEIDDWEARARSMPTVADELANLPQPVDPAKAVYVIHAPPTSFGLDVCMDGSTPGSEAVRDFIIARQPFMSLHGHIHESPEMSGVHTAKLGRTVCVQPGQTGRLTYVYIDTDTLDVRRIRDI